MTALHVQLDRLAVQALPVLNCAFQVPSQLFLARVNASLALLVNIRVVPETLPVLTASQAHFAWRAQHFQHSAVQAHFLPALGNLRAQSAPLASTSLWMDQQRASRALPAASVHLAQQFSFPAQEGVTQMHSELGVLIIAPRVLQVPPARLAQQLQLHAQQAPLLPALASLSAACALLALFRKRAAQ